MTKKSQLLATILSITIGLGLAGVLLVAKPLPVRADIVISQEVGGNTPDGGSSGGGSLVVSPEVSGSTDNEAGEGRFVTPGGELAQGGEGNFTTPTDPPPPTPENPGGGNGGGGGGGGGGRRKVKPPTTVAPTPCVFPYLTKHIKWGAANDPVEVAKLQRFLREHEQLEVPLNGVYDETTLTAVMIFQRRYAADVLEPWGLTGEQPTGFVFITTTLVINRLYCEMSTKHDLDLRHVYDESPAPAKGGSASGEKEGNATDYLTDARGVVASSPATTAPDRSLASSTRNLAVTGAGAWRGGDWSFWLNLLLVLIILVLIYLLWRERQFTRRYLNYDEDSYRPDQASEEIEIDDDEPPPPANLPAS